MLLKKLPIWLTVLLIIWSSKLIAQSPCTTLGQNPTTAFPVCGTAVFQQDSVPICSSNNLYVPGCSIPGDTASTYQNKNPFWYKFTCFQSGTLSFIIRPNSPNEDYDWQLYDITGHHPDDVYTDTSLVVTGNWAGTYDSTGASATGVNYIQCASEPTANAPTFALSPYLVQGHNYLLLVSHFSDTEQGYTLSFGGGTAVITDTLPPHMFTASRASCDGSQMLVKLNKRMKCSSLAINGSDFIISPPVANVIHAEGIGCSGAFDMDSVLLTFSTPLPVGNYNLIAQTGTDGNTLLDLCNNDLPAGESIPFSVTSPLPVPFDSLRNNKCMTDSLVLVFEEDIQCQSVAYDGTDFTVTGTYPVVIANAYPFYCNNGLTRTIVVHFTSTLVQPGNFQIILQQGSDGNTLLSKCDTPSVAGSAIPFSILPRPVAGFSFPASVCLPNASVTFTNNSSIADGSESSFSFLWNFDDAASGGSNTSFQKSPTHSYNSVGPFNVSLRVTSNAGCTNSITIPVNSIHPQPITSFGISKKEICEGDEVFLSDSTNSMDGITTQWFWNLGDGSVANTPNLLHTYPTAGNYPISLFTINSHGCKSDVRTRPVVVHPYPVVNAGPDRKVLEGGIITIQARATGTNLQYSWTPPLYLDNPGGLNPICIDPKFDVLYTLKVTAPGGCSRTDNMFVDVLKVPSIPNTFSPNDDGINDTWQIRYLDEYTNNRLQVFTRAGQLVYENKGLYKPWDGRFKGNPLPMDTYYYIIEPGEGRDPVTGFVTIVR